MDIGTGATILVNVELNGIEQGKAALNAFGSVGEQSANRVQKAYQQVAASAMDFARAGANANQIAQLTGSSLKEARDAAALYSKTLATTEEEVRGLQRANQELAESGLLRVSTASTTVTEAVAKTNPALNSMRASMTALTASALQTAPGVAQVASVLGNLAIGAGPMVAVLAGIAAVAFAYEKLTEASRKAKEEQDKAVTSVKEMVRLNNAGLGGKLALDLEALRARAKALREDAASYADVLAGNKSGKFTGIDQIASGFAEIFRVAFGGQSFTQKAAEATKLAAAAQEELAQRFGQTTGAMALQVQRQNDLNAASDKGQLAQDLINNRFEYFNELLKNSHGTTEAERAALNALALAQKNVSDEAARIADQERKNQESWAETTKVINDAEKVFAKMTMTSVELAKALNNLGGGGGVQLTPDMHGRASADTAKLLQGLIYNVPVAKVPPGFPDPEKVKKYAEDVRRIWSDGISKIVTDGFKSFHDFFEDVLQLFSSLTKRMQQEGRSTGLLQFGSSAIAGGLAGYGAGSTIGSMTGSGGVKSALMGSFAGAATGAAAGTAVLPGIGTIVGLAVGEIAGLAGALISGSKAAKERKVAEEQLRQSLELSLAQMRVLVGAATPLSLALTQNAEAFKSLRMQTEAAFAGRKNEAERESRLRELTELEQRRAQQIQEEAAKEAAEAAARLAAEAERAAQEMRDLAKSVADAAAAAAEAARKLNEQSQQSSMLRFFDATGQADLAFALRQAIEIQQAITDGLNAQSIELLKQAQAAEKAARETDRAAASAERMRDVQAQAIQEQIRGAQEILNTTRQAIDGVRKYLDSSKLGALSPLGDQARFDEAKRQYLALANAASGGDVKAYASLPDAVEAYRREAQNMFASGQGRADVFNQTQIFLESLTDKFGAQATIQEQMLAALNAQLDIARQQLDATKAIPKKVEDLVTAIGAPSGPRVDPTLPPGTGGPITPPRRIPVRNIDDLFSMLDSHFYSVRQQNTSLGDYVARTNAVLSSELPSQTVIQRQTRDYSKQTADGVARLRPELDIGGVVH